MDTYIAIGLFALAVMTTVLVMGKLEKSSHR